MRYRVKAMRGMSEVVTLPIEALSAQEAVGRARGEGYDVLSVRAERVSALRPRRSRAGFAVVPFAQELVALLEAGLNLVEAIEALHGKERLPAHQGVLGGLLASLRQGKRFSAALEAYALIFSPLFVATVRAAKRTGTVKEALTRYVHYQLQIERIRAKIVSASIYPALLLLVGGGVALFLLGYVVPRFSRIYEDIGSALPWASRLLAHVGQLIDRHGVLMLAGVLALAATFYSLLGQPRVRGAFARLLWGLPLLGAQARLYELARFYRTLSMLVRSGMPALAALGMAKGVLSAALQANVERASALVREGGAFSLAMQANALTTPIAYRMLVVAERSGSLGEMLERVAAFHEEELSRFVDWFTRLFEPLLMALIGVVIGMIVVLMYMPIFDLAGSIQ